MRANNNSTAFAARARMRANHNSTAFAVGAARSAALLIRDPRSAIPHLQRIINDAALRAGRRDPTRFKLRGQSSALPA